jgi:hypothetical protein
MTSKYLFYSTPMYYSARCCEQNLIGPGVCDSKNVWLEEGKENLEIGIVLVNDDVQNNTTM